MDLQIGKHRNFIDIEDVGADLNSTSTVTDSIDITGTEGVYMQVVTSGSVSVVHLQISGNGSDWVNHFDDVKIVGNGGRCHNPVMAKYARLKVTTAEGSPQTGTLILQAK